MEVNISFLSSWSQFRSEAFELKGVEGVVVPEVADDDPASAPSHLDHGRSLQVDRVHILLRVLNTQDVNSP